METPSKALEIRRTKLKDNSIEFKVEFSSKFTSKNISFAFYTVRESSEGEDIFLDGAGGVIKLDTEKK